MIHIIIFDIEALFVCYTYASSIYFERKCYVLASQMEPLHVHSICKVNVMGFFVSKNENSFNIVST